MTPSIDLNADLGESEDEAAIARDIAIMDVVTSVNIACGGHAGSEDIMKIMLEAAKARGVAVGAHPSYRDRENFGRVSMKMNAEDLYDEIWTQTEDLASLAERNDMKLSHVKPHGALYNDAVDDTDLADIVGEASNDCIPRIPVMGLAGGVAEQTASKLHSPFIPEAFIDRRYTPTGRLVPRSQAGAVIENTDERITQAVSIAKHGKAIASDGTEISINAQTLCLHSDSDGALETARAVRNALEDAGIEVKSPS